MSLVMMTESTAGQPYLIIRVGHSMLYNTKVYIFHFVRSADHIWLKHIALSPSISYCTYMPVCRVWQVHARASFKKAFCAHQNRSIARGSVGPTKSFAPDFQGRSRDIIFWQIYPNLSVLPLSTSLAYTFAFLSVW